MSLTSDYTLRGVPWTPRKYVVDFFLANPQIPKLHTVRAEDNPRVMDLLRSRKCPGYYRDNVITVMPELYTKAGTGYSWPGHVSDRTEHGVIAHELGHHVYFSNPSLFETASKSDIWQKTTQITAYEKARGPKYFVEEAFAETFRLFLLNPDLLKVGRHNRYGFMTKKLSLKPIEFRPWREVLGEIPKHMLERVGPWMERSFQKDIQIGLFDE